MRISDKQRIVLGPPGTGKTTFVLNEVEDLMEKGCAPDRIAFVSFTKKAIGEAIDRATDKFNLSRNRFSLFKTIHSLCFNGLGISKKDMVSKEYYREFGEHVGYIFEGTWDESEGIPVGDEKGDILLFLDNLARITEQPLRKVWEENHTVCEWEELERFQEAYQDFKSAKMIMDFTDLLSAYVQMCDPVVADNVIVDEAQDLSRLQWKVLKHAFKNVEQTTIAGDDDQSIYKWSGADLESFLNLEGDKKVLEQSYRIPKSVHEFATGLISKVNDRFDKPFKPREEKGSVEFYQSLYDLDFDNSEKTLFLVRNTYLSNRVAERLYTLGIPFIKGGYSSIRSSHVKAINAVEKLTRNEPISGSEAKHLFENMRIGEYLERGKKSQIITLPDTTHVTFNDLQDKYGLKNLGPWYDCLTGIKPETLDYYRSILSNGYGLTGAPNYSVSTIHAAKGGEAEHVVILSDMAQRSYQEYEKYPDDERRVAYVAVTRAKKKVSIIQPQGKRYFDYYMEATK